MTKQEGTFSLAEMLNGLKRMNDMTKSSQQQVVDNF